MYMKVSAMWEVRKETGLFFSAKSGGGEEARLVVGVRDQQPVEHVPHRGLELPVDALREPRPRLLGDRVLALVEVHAQEAPVAPRLSMACASTTCPPWAWAGPRPGPPPGRRWPAPGAGCPVCSPPRRPGPRRDHLLVVGEAAGSRDLPLVAELASALARVADRRHLESGEYALRKYRYW